MGVPRDWIITNEYWLPSISEGIEVAEEIRSRAGLSGRDVLSQVLGSYSLAGSGYHSSQLVYFTQLELPWQAISAIKKIRFEK